MMTYSDDLVVLAKPIRLVGFDVDGVLTDGSISFLSNGEEIKTFNAKDGQGLAMVLRTGIQVAIITARQSPMVSRRAAELGIQHVHQAAKNKLAVLQELMSHLAITPHEVAYMGDDLPDLAVLNTVSLPTCPADAVPEVHAVCKFISAYPGGRGAVRDLTNLLLFARQP